LEADLEYCSKNGISIARRFTGGGAVYHDTGNLNFAICANQKESYVARTLPELYSDFVGNIAFGLSKIGIEASYDEYRSCIRIGNRKITGTAGWIKRGVSFIHGTLLIDTDLEKLTLALSPPAGQTRYLRDEKRIRCKESYRDIVTCIRRSGLIEISDVEIEAAVIESIENYTKESLVIGDLTSKEREVADSLYQSRYSRSTWNLGTPIPE
ncbi:MAG: biotin/lipoate A/B protein ligase family protein, partial [Candidatus Hodarchaeota archaeon]